MPWCVLRVKDAVRLRNRNFALCDKTFKQMEEIVRQHEFLLPSELVSAVRGSTDLEELRGPFLFRPSVIDRFEPYAEEQSRIMKRLVHD